MSTDQLNTLLQTLIPIGVTLLVTVLHSRSGGKLPLLSSLLTALGIPPASGPVPGPVVPATPTTPAVSVHFGDGHILAAILGAIRGNPVTPSVPVAPVTPTVPTSPAAGGLDLSALIAALLPLLQQSQTPTAPVVPAAPAMPAHS